MIKTLRRLSLSAAFCSLSLMFLFQCSVPVNSWALAKRYQSSLKTQYRWMILWHPHYVMSDTIKPDDPISKGVDCSRYKYLVYHWAGVPGVKRVTAYDMAMGKGGWIGEDISIDEAEELDIVWWTWKDKPQRKHGHVGTIWIGKTGLMQVTHSGLSRGVVVDEWKGKLARDVSKVRRITIGDPPKKKLQ